MPPVPITAGSLLIANLHLHGRIRPWIVEFRRWHRAVLL